MIRDARLPDAPACADILQQWIGETKWFPTLAPQGASAASMENRINTGQVKVAEKAGEVIGFVAYTAGYLDCLYLADGARNAGLGRALLAHAKNQGPISLWVLQQNQAARRFYLREGFVEMEQGDGADNEEGLPDIRLEWKPETPHE